MVRLRATNVKQLAASACSVRRQARVQRRLHSNRAHTRVGSARAAPVPCWASADEALEKPPAASIAGGAAFSSAGRSATARAATNAHAGRTSAAARGTRQQREHQQQRRRAACWSPQGVSQATLPKSRAARCEAHRASCERFSWQRGEHDAQPRLQRGQPGLHQLRRARSVDFVGAARAISPAPQPARAAAACSHNTSVAVTTRCAVLLACRRRRHGRTNRQSTVLPLLRACARAQQHVSPQPSVQQRGARFGRALARFAPAQRHGPLAIGTPPTPPNARRSCTGRRRAGTHVTDKHRERRRPRSAPSRAARTATRHPAGGALRPASASPGQLLLREQRTRRARASAVVPRGRVARKSALRAARQAAAAFASGGPPTHSPPAITLCGPGRRRRARAAAAAAAAPSPGPRRGARVACVRRSGMPAASGWVAFPVAAAFAPSASRAHRRRTSARRRALAPARHRPRAGDVVPGCPAARQTVECVKSSKWPTVRCCARLARHRRPRGREEPFQLKNEPLPRH